MKPRCFYCNRTMVQRRSSRWTSTAITRDHVIPRCHPDFPGDRNNVVIACARCNEARGHAPAILFLLFAVRVLQPRPRGSVREVKGMFSQWVRAVRPQQTEGLVG